jgi:hypothetical protein
MYTRFEHTWQRSPLPSLATGFSSLGFAFCAVVLSSIALLALTVCFRSVSGSSSNSVAVGANITDFGRGFLATVGAPDATGTCLVAGFNGAAAAAAGVGAAAAAGASASKIERVFFCVGATAAAAAAPAPTDDGCTVGVENARDGAGGLSAVNCAASARRRSTAS